MSRSCCGRLRISRFLENNVATRSRVAVDEYLQRLVKMDEVLEFSKPKSYIVVIIAPLFFVNSFQFYVRNEDVDGSCYNGIVQDAPQP